MGVRTSWGSATDRGRVRTLNEDSLLAYPPVFLVADGMGGHEAGDVASRIAVEEFSQLAGRTEVTADDVHACFHRAAERLRSAVPEGSTAGTTIAGVAVTVHDGGSYWLVFNIGDSRVYLFAGGELAQVSVDHSVVQELVDRGAIDPEDAVEHPDRNVITRAVGTGTEPDPDYWLIPAGPTDRVLVCSDGLTRELDDADLAALLGRFADPQEAAQHLVAAAVRAGGHDNVSAVVVDVAVVHDAVDTDTTVPPRPSISRAVDETTTDPGQARAAAGAPRTGAAGAQHGGPQGDPWDEDVDGATVPRPPRGHVPEVNR